MIKCRIFNCKILTNCMTFIDYHNSWDLFVSEMHPTKMEGSNKKTVEFGSKLTKRPPLKCMGSLWCFFFCMWSQYDSEHSPKAFEHNDEDGWDLFNDTNRTTNDICIDRRKTCIIDRNNCISMFTHFDIRMDVFWFSCWMGYTTCIHTLIGCTEHTLIRAYSSRDVNFRH